MSTGTASTDYSFAGAIAGLKPKLGDTTCNYQWAVTQQGVSSKHGTSSGVFDWEFITAKGENGVFLPPDDRWRVIVQETRTGQITCRDLNVTNLVIQRALSAGCDISCDVNPNDASAAGIYPKPWEQYIHIEKVMLGKPRIWASAIVQPSDVDEKTGILHLKAKGFATYPKGIPWLQDINWIANDAFRPVVQIWSHLQQDFANGNLGVTVFPATSGVEMLPGYAFDGNLLNLNFFATFIRQTDKLDCGDYIDALARDIPFDYRELSYWNAGRTDINKYIQLGYPRLGLIQENIVFVLNENVLSAKPHTETQIDYISDIGITGFFPGIEFSSQLVNADPTRLRRYLDENDAFIDSNERAQAWAGRKLARRQTPAYWETLTINPNHPNAPMGSFDVGDSIVVKGNMNWVGDLNQFHKIIAISVDVAKNVVQLTIKAEGAFNYDPIFFPGNTNIIFNHAFDSNLTGWTQAIGSGCSWDGTQGHGRLGSLKVVADGTDHWIVTQAYGLSDFQIFPMSVWVKCSNAFSNNPVGIQLVAQFYDAGSNPTETVPVANVNPNGMLPWTALGGWLETPIGSSSVAFELHVGPWITAGTVWFDDAALIL